MLEEGKFQGKRRENEEKDRIRRDIRKGNTWERGERRKEKKGEEEGRMEKLCQRRKCEDPTIQF